MEVEPEVSFNSESDAVNLPEIDQPEEEIDNLDEALPNDGTLDDDEANNTDGIEKEDKPKTIKEDPTDMDPEMDVDHMVQNLLESRNPEISPLQCSECDLECPSLSALKFHTQLHVMERMVQSSYKYPGVGLKKPGTRTRPNSSRRRIICMDEDEANDIETMMESLVGTKKDKVKSKSKTKIKGEKTNKSKTKKIAKRRRKGKSKKMYKCPECAERFNLKRNLKAHMKEEHPDFKGFSCSYCGYKCKINALLTRHMLTHTGAKPYGCPVCDYRCNDKGNLEKHMVIHRDERPFSCPEEGCDYKCKLKCNLKSHMLKHAPSEKPHKCTICDYSSVFKGDLQTHMYKHTGERPFPCPTCGKGYTSKNNLKVHQRTHTDDKKFKCEHCDYRAYTLQKLNQHNMTHTGERPHECEACGMRFSRKSNLNKHMKTHIAGRVRQRRQSKPKNELSLNVNSLTTISVNNLTQPLYVARKLDKIPTTSDLTHRDDLVTSYDVFGSQSAGSSQMPYDLSQHSEVSNDSSQHHQTFHLGNTQSLNNQHIIGTNTIMNRNNQQTTHLDINHKNDNYSPSKTIWHQGNSNIPISNPDEYHYQNFIDKLLQTRQQAAGEHMPQISQNYSHTPLPPHSRPMFIESTENTHLNSKLPSTMPVPTNMSQMIRNANYMYNIQ